MLKEFIKHIQETTTPRTITVDGHTFLVTSDGNAAEVVPNHYYPATLNLNSLDALAKLVRTEAS